MRSAPLNSFAKRLAISMVSGYRARPLMYISSLGSSFAFTSTGKVLESFSPNSRPFFSASSLSLWNIGTASLYWRSSRKCLSSKAI